MKIRTVLLAGAMLAVVTGGAFAQGAMSSPSGSSVTTPQQTPTPGSANNQTQQKNKSPGSTDSGIKQDK